jgi:hypothetical protein
VPPFVLYRPRRDLREYFEQIAFHKICFGHASCNVSSVQLPVSELEPFPKVFQAQQSIVSERICAIVANTTEL